MLTRARVNSDAEMNDMLKKVRARANDSSDESSDDSGLD